jgi:hypothetical protein
MKTVRFLGLRVAAFAAPALAAEPAYEVDVSHVIFANPAPPWP